MQIRDMMNLNYARIPIGSSMCEAAEVFATSQASDLMVIDADDDFVGVLSEGDLIRAVMPKFEDLMFSSGTFVDRFDEFVQKGKENKDAPIDELVIRKPLTYAPDDDALKAAATMVAKQIRRLPVVEDGKLVGVVSRADVCRTIFAD
jgi:CBS domain-containing protein